MSISYYRMVNNTVRW